MQDEVMAPGAASEEAQVQDLGAQAEPPLHDAVAEALRAVEARQAAAAAAAPEAPPAGAPGDDGLEYYNDEDNGPLPEPPSAGEAPGAGGAMPSQVAALEAALAAKTAEAEELDLMLKRMAADFENFRRREREGKDELIKSAAKRVLENLVDVLDNFERALQAGASATEPGQVLEGVKLIHKQMEQFLSREGVEQIPAKGSIFDPNLHEAVMSREVDDLPDQTVLEVFRAGYTLHGKVLRPSMVQVASNPSMPAAPASPAEAPAAEAAEA